jgi:HK97 family phage prohead protease
VTFKFLSQRRFHNAARHGGTPASVAVRHRSDGVVSTDEDRRIVRFRFSDGSLDRAGDTINPLGWELENFLKNPVALWAHDSHQPPVGRAVQVWADSTGLYGDVQFADAGTYPFAETVYQLLKKRFLNAVSVGFMPLEYEFSDDPERRGGVDFIRQELMEISVVPVPALASALVTERAKSLTGGRTLRELPAAMDPDDLAEECRDLQDRCDDLIEGFEALRARNRAA